MLLKVLPPEDPRFGSEGSAQGARVDPSTIFVELEKAPPPPPPNPAATAAPAPATPPQPPALPFTVRSLWLDADGTFYVVLNASGRE